MTPVSHVPCGDTRHHHGNPNASDDMSDVTPPIRGNGSLKDQGMVSKVIKFRFKLTTGKRGSPVTPSLIHTHWIDAIQETFGSDVDIINNKSQKLDRIDLLQWSTNPLQHQKHFKIYQKSTGRDSNKKTTAYILHRIQTNESINSIKTAPKIQKILRENDCFVTEHRWDETVWDTAVIGFVTTIDPSFYNADQAHTKFLTMLQQKKNEINTLRVKIKIPEFKMVFSSPTTYTDNNTRTSTKAYSIEVKHSDQPQMMQTLKSLLSDNLNTFVPYTMRYKYPEGFKNAIKFQTWQISNNSIIVLQNISESAMYYMDTYIKAINGVKDLLPANDVEYTGRHKMLVEKSHFNQIRNRLITSLSEWYNIHVPSDALPREGKFSGPPRVKPIMRDGESSGENSWVSRSSASFTSMDLSMVQNDDYFSTSQTATMAFTYASAVSTPASTTVLKAKNANIVDDETKEIISDITGTRTDSEIQQHKLEMDRLIEQQKQEQAASQAIMAAQQLEIQRLTEAYQRANIAYEEVTAELRQQRIHVNTIITEQLSLADKKRNEEMDSLRYEMMKTMKEMLQNTQHSNNRSYGTNNSQIKRSQHDEDTMADHKNTYEKRQEKRADRRQTPTKKLIFDEEHLSEGLMTQCDSHRQQDGNEASSTEE